MSKDINRVIEDILERLQKIESKINVEKKPKTTKVTMEKFSGAKGGALLLISKGFFSKKRMISEAKAEFDKLEYFYSSQVIQTALNRLSGKKGPLIVTEQKGKKVYAN